MRVGAVATALVGASLAHMPLVYLLVDAPDRERALIFPILLVTFVGMSDAWVAGLILEGRSARLAWLAAGATVVEPPLLHVILGMGELVPVPLAFYAFSAVAALAAVAALVLLGTARHGRREARSGST